MKKILGLVLVLCLVLSFATDALAAKKVQITKQPESATTNKQGTVKFSIKIKGSANITWYFVNPATGEKTTGRKLNTVFKKVKVSGANKNTITLKKVPEEMHGWYVYCHLTSNGYKLDSKMVVLNVYGKDPAPEPANPETIPGEGETVAAAPEVGTTSDDGYLITSDDDDDKGIDPEAVEVKDKPITVSATAKVLYKVNNMGKVEDTEPSSTLDFINSGSFLVKSSEPIKKFTLNGMRFEPAEPLYEFKILNVTDSVSLNLTTARVPIADQNLDTSNMVHVSCQGCTFTYMPTLISVSQGQVPSGAFITVIGGNSDLLANGYSVNGGAPDHQGLASFRIQVTEDTNIVLQ